MSLLGEWLPGWGSAEYREAWGMETPKPELWASLPQAAEIDAFLRRAADLTNAEIQSLEMLERVASGTCWHEVAHIVDVLSIAGREGIMWGARERLAQTALWAREHEIGLEGFDELDQGGGSGDLVWGREFAFAFDLASLTLQHLLARDLVGVLPRGRYNFGTYPWRMIVGPIHPDDEVLG